MTRITKSPLLFLISTTILSVNHLQNVNAFSVVNSVVQPYQTKSTIGAGGTTKTPLFANVDDNEESSPVVVVQQQLRKRDKVKTFGKLLVERSDTLRSAGFYNTDTNEYPPPVEAGFKTNFILFCLAFGYKTYRSVFINKMAVWERQPQWNTVITSKEMEEKANLEAMSCNNCGSILFIAKGRKWFQMPNGYECYACGAKGEENFTNTREDLLDEIEDDYFDYEKPLDFITASERRQLMKEAGGDEEKAIALLTQQNADAASTGEESSEGGGGAGDDGEGKKKKKKKKGKKKKKKKKSVEASATDEDSGDATEKPAPEKKEKKSDLDELDMDSL